jgi:hypothetical protein
LLDPIWRGWDHPREEDRLVGPIYCLVNRRGGDIVHLGSFLGRCGGGSRDRREVPMPKVEQQRIVRGADADGMREKPLREDVPDLEWVAPEVRFFQDWMDSSAVAHRVFAHCAGYS